MHHKTNFLSLPCFFRNTLKTSVLSCVLAFVFSSCGPNLFKDVEKKDPAEDATVALEAGKPDDAISILTDALADDPGNEQYLSILSLAYAQRAGIDPLTLAQKMGSGSGGSSSSSSSSSNSLTALFAFMPEATDANIADVDLAIAALGQIPAANLKSYDILKLAIFQTSAMVLRTKALDTDGDGTISAAELLAMSPTSAAAILGQLANAAISFSGTGEGSTTNAAAGAKIEQIRSSIASEAGETDADKLKSYLGKSAT